MRKWSGFRRSFSAVNELWWLVAAFYLLDVWSPVVAFHLSPAWVLGEQVFFAGIKIILSAIFYGLIVDRILGRCDFPSADSIKCNARSFWAVAFLLFILPYVLHFIFFAFSGKPLPLHLVQAMLGPVVAVVWLRVVLAVKGVRGPQGELILLDGTGWLYVVLAVVGYYAAYAFYWFVPEGAVFLKRASIFFLKYADAWMFSAFVVAIVRSLPLTPRREGKEIILVNPAFGGIAQDGFSFFLEAYPCVFVVLRALSPAGYTFREYNRRPWRDDFYQGGALVAITCLTNNAMAAYKIAKEFRKKGSKVVMGGAHVTAFPEEALEFCDAVVIGPAENVWARLVEDYEQGQLKSTYQAAPTSAMYERVLDFLATQPPETIADCLETTRGCKFNCYFCGGGHLGIGHHSHDIDRVLALVARVREHRRRINFIDDNIYSNPGYAKEFFSRLKELDVQWEGNSSLDMAKDPEAVRLCKESGCVRLSIGYEIFPGSQEAARGGKFAMADDYVKLTRVLQKSGIPVKANLMYGSLTDGFWSFWRMWWFVMRLFPRGALMTLLTPKPNSAFYAEISRQDDFINLNWNRVNGYALIYRHPHINNPFFRDGYIFVAIFFFLTTSFLGRCMLVGGVLLLPLLRYLLSLG